MPRFFFDTYNTHIDIDQVGQDLPDIKAVRFEVRKALPSLLQEGIMDRDKAQFRIDVRDENGKRLVTASALMVLDYVDDLD